MEAWISVHADWAKLRKCWLTLLLEPGCILSPNNAAASPCMVLYVCRWGCLVWPLERKTSGTLQYMSFATCSAANPTPWRFVTITEIRQFRAARVVAVPPACHVGVRPGKNCPSGIVIRMDGAAMVLERFAAFGAFASLTVDMMSELYTHDLKVC